MASFKLRNIIFFLLLVCLFFASCNGQTKQTNENTAGQLSFTSRKTKLTKTQGANEHQNVHCSLQAKDGNLWFGTTGEGVFRYDGTAFTQFTEKDGLSNNSIWSILEDKLGNIWFGTDDGISRFDGRTISRVSFSVTSSNSFLTMPQMGKSAVWSILQDKSGMIWFGTSQDLYCYDGKSFSRFLDRSNILNNQKLQLKWIQCFLEDSSGTIWMGSGPNAMEGVVQFDGKSVTSAKPNGDGWIRYMVKDKNENIWFGGRSRGNFIYNGKTFVNFTGKAEIGNPVLIDRSGNVWFNGVEKQSTVESVGGIWCYDGKTFKNYTTADGIGKYFAFSMLEDRNKNIWIGTRSCELYRYDGKNFAPFSE